MTNENGLENVIVVIDDDEGPLNAMKRFISKKLTDYQGMYFNSPLLALEYLSVHKPKLVLSDKDMPQMNGVELQRKVMELSFETKRLIYTGAPDENVKNAVKEGIILEYFVKPDLAPIVEKMKKYLEK